jgi:C_GCAxxG_C_C family probable redox protein
MRPPEAAARARSLFLDEANSFGCAETTFMVLKEAFGLPDPDDPSAAMALNGGVAYAGGVCGAISGAALAVGMLTGRECADHDRAKATAREVIARTMDEFRLQFGATDCRTLLGRDIRTAVAHRDFIESGVWRVTCMDQIEFVVDRLAPGLGGRVGSDTPCEPAAPSRRVRPPRPERREARGS